MTSIEELIQIENPEEYDFKLETANSLFSALDSSIERFLLYKSGLCMGSKYFPEMDMFIREDNRIFGLQAIDCDTSPLTLSVYKKLWKDEISGSESSGITGEYGDTMTSFQTLLNCFVEGKIESHLQREYRIRYYPTKPNSVTKMYCLHLYYSMSDFIKMCNQYDAVEKFAKAVHSIGNYIPVPRWFNVNRAHHDYWDLTLCKIREWYMVESVEEKDEVLKTLLCNKSNVIGECRKWLTWCGKGDNGENGWRSFVKINYMETFVNEETYMPILFYENHAWDDVIDAEHALLIFEKNAELIFKRGRQMIEACFH